MKPGLELCGLGVRPAEDTTLETLEALRGCSEVYAELADPASFAWLKSLFPGVKKAPGAAGLVKAAGSARVGLAVWGHPLYCSRLAREVQLLAQKKGVACRMSAAVSPVGRALTSGPDFFGGAQGNQAYQGYDLETLLEPESRPAPELPLVVYAEAGSPASWKRLAARLAPLYPPGHKALLTSLPQGDSKELALAELGAAAPKGALLQVLPAKPMAPDEGWK